MDSKMKRRDFLKISALAGVAVVAAACQPIATPTAAPTVAPKATEVPKATAVPTTAATAMPKPTEAPKPTVVPTAAGFKGDIVMHAGYYIPTSATNNPDPKAPKYTALDILANEWMASHPGIKISFFNEPVTSDWLDLALAAGTGPDVLVFVPLANANRYADEGKVVPLNDYLELPNKYTPEDKTAWKNTFKAPYLTEFSIKGNWGGIPLDLAASGVFCNVDMFREIGVDIKKEIVPELGSPKSWATLIDWCKRFKEAGYFGFSCTHFITWWLQGVLGDQLFWQLIPTLDVLNYHTNIPKQFQGGLVSQEETVHQYVCKDWKAFSEPATRTMFEIIKELSLYMPVGFDLENGWGGGPGMETFLTGQVAMTWTVGQNLGPVMQDDRRKFEFSTFWLPPLTKETTILAKDPPILPVGVGGYSVGFGINRKCIKKGNIDDCVDWLMYITTPAHDEMIVNEVPGRVTSQKKAKSLPEVESMFVGETRLVGGSWAGHTWTQPENWFADTVWNSKYTDAFDRDEVLYLLGEQDLDTFMTNADAAAQAAVPDIIRSAAVQYSETGTWDLTQWSCTPKI